MQLPGSELQEVNAWSCRFVKRRAFLVTDRRAEQQIAQRKLIRLCFATPAARFRMTSCLITASETERITTCRAAS